MRKSKILSMLMVFVLTLSLGIGLMPAYAAAADTRGVFCVNQGRSITIRVPVFGWGNFRASWANMEGNPSGMTLRTNSILIDTDNDSNWATFTIAVAGDVPLDDYYLTVTITSFSYNETENRYDTLGGVFSFFRFECSHI